MLEISRGYSASSHSAAAFSLSRPRMKECETIPDSPKLRRLAWYGIGSGGRTQIGRFIAVARAEEVAEGKGLVVRAEDHEIGLFRVEGALRAIDNICPHRGGPLAEGFLEGKILTCPWHAWTFDVTSGQCTFVPGARVQTFEVKVEEGLVKILLDGTDEA
ncbi:MAG: Rieske (2Fe-2S) protein [Acidobacteriota bacterium]